jgi:hypothetical protein
MTDLAKMNKDNFHKAVALLLHFVGENGSVALSQSWYGQVYDDISSYEIHETPSNGGVVLTIRRTNEQPK